jgi:hypothetical protein
METSRHEVFPANWHIAADYDPNHHLMQLKGRDYLNVQNRLLWFIRDQRSFISMGLARVPYVIRTELVEMDREAGFAHFKTYVRDVLGNEATMYGSESAKDFGDYAEKASTKSLGRALLALGYGTAFAPEMDEGERVVDSPVDRRRSAPRVTAAAQASTMRETPPAPAAAAANSANGAHSAPGHSASAANATAGLVGANGTGAKAPATPAASTARPGEAEAPASEQQLVSIRKLCAALGKPEPDSDLTYNQARGLITQLSGEYQQKRRAS